MTLSKSTAFAALAMSLTGTANAQGTRALGDTSLRPLDITCADLTGIGDEERAGLVFFIAGYQAAMKQMGAGSGSGAAGEAGGAGGGEGGQEVMIKRGFFSIPAHIILAGCATGSDMKVADVISAAQD